jgi:predicted glycosyltransferase
VKVWIDLANSPHPLLFEPVARRLEAEGAEVAVTVRDHAQTLALARQRWPGATLIGEASAAERLPAKALGVAGRVRGLRSWARRERPDVALSHNSYAQILAARSLRIPAVTGMDYEHQPANHVGFRGAQRILMPEAVPAGAVRRQGASGRKIVRYPGLKEELYLRGFGPDEGALAAAGIDPSAPLAVARSAPAGAAYHPGENPLFAELLAELGRREGLTTVVLARHPEQRLEIERLGLPGLLLLDAVIDSGALLSAAGLFVGAGGTMTREAALLGVPTFSAFAGRPAAVDAWLEERGMLRRIGSAADLPAEVGRKPAPERAERLAASGERIEDIFVRATLESIERGRSS